MILRLHNIKVLKTFSSSNFISTFYKRDNSIKISFSRSEGSYCKYQKQIFSAIQPSGELHLGNYLGAIQKWVQLQNNNENVIFGIADLHALTLPKIPDVLRKNILLMVATLLATGIDPSKSILFQQSDVHQHCELCWIFITLPTMAQLSHLHQYRQKSAVMKNVPVGIFIYPILQVADICLYKATHIPVGSDQKQHVELANNIIRTFNRTFGETFPITVPLIDDFAGGIKSLCDPSKKMSKSGPEKSQINIMDTPDEILFKCRKAVSDFTSQITYEPENRPGVSNLVLIHSLLTNKSIEDICKEVENLNTFQYKILLAEVITESLKPIKEKIQLYMSSPAYLEDVLRRGAEKASERAEATLNEVKSKIGINIKEVSTANVTADSNP